ncbi:MAG: acetate--CoA ligase family protein [Candidatus Bathyarchaeota archaeon]|nr:acetate--CoA ligase family protein [Candidatus Bathyarchaeota archaeon]
MADMQRISEIIAQARKQNRSNLMEHEAKEVCQEYNISVTKFKLARSIEEAVKLAEEIGYPVVLKIVSPSVIHKSEVGGVLLDLNTSIEVENGYRTILANVKKLRPNSQIEGILVQEMAPSSVEVIVGAIKDDQFGQSIMFGLGGIFVEVLDDVVFRIAPVTKQEAESMITEIKAYKVLKGYRNQPPSDIEAIAEIISNTSKLVTDYEDINELDLNPIMVYEKGAKTVDARIILE